MICSDVITLLLKMDLEKPDGFSKPLSSPHTLFPDIYGFTQSNSHDKIIKHFSTEEFYYKGEDQWRDGSLEWAAEYYKMAYTKKSGWIDARCKCALALNWNGEQSKTMNCEITAFKNNKHKDQVISRSLIMNTAL